jgi:hypothetical protein
LTWTSIIRANSASVGGLRAVGGVVSHSMKRIFSGFCRTGS